MLPSLQSVMFRVRVCVWPCIQNTRILSISRTVHDKCIRVPVRWSCDLWRTCWTTKNRHLHTMRYQPQMSMNTEWTHRVVCGNKLFHKLIINTYNSVRNIIHFEVECKGFEHIEIQLKNIRDKMQYLNHNKVIRNY